jgi:hypothetical protein
VLSIAIMPSRGYASFPPTNPKVPILFSITALYSVRGFARVTELKVACPDRSERPWCAGDPVHLDHERRLDLPTAKAMECFTFGGRKR